MDSASNYSDLGQLAHMLSGSLPTTIPMTKSTDESGSLGLHGLRDRVIEPIAQQAARLLTHLKPGEVIRFGRVSSRELHEVCHMRREVYKAQLTSLLPLLDNHGQDAFDAQSFMFCAWLDGRPVATIRATPYPFETLQYVSEETLGSYLGPNWQSEYIEWGRLAARSETGARRITPALIVYAGLRMLLGTSYSKYFGYTRARVAKLFRGFQLMDDSLKIKIPSRGDHDYRVIRGSFSMDLFHVLPRLLRPLSRTLRVR